MSKIPQHIMDRAWSAYIRDKNLQAVRNEMAYSDLRGPMPPPPDARQSLLAALEAVAPGLWEQGFARGVGACEVDAALHETGEIGLNPYEEDA